MVFDPFDRTPTEALRETKRVSVEDLELDQDFVDFGSTKVNREVVKAFRVNRYGR